MGHQPTGIADRQVAATDGGFAGHPQPLQQLGRVVLQRQQTSSTTRNQKIMFQLEFNGFSKVGGSSLQSIQANVPKYQYLREEIVQPNRFDQYD